MLWLALTFSCVCFWGCTNILFKKSANIDDTLTPYKGLVWVGIVMTVSGLIALCFSDTFASSVSALSDNLYLIPVAILYPIALFFGLVGNRHLDASVISPLENIDAAIASIILYFYFLSVGNSNIANSISHLDIIGTGIIILGVVALGFQEQRLSKQELKEKPKIKRHRLGAIALIFPIVYNLVDALSMVATGITVSETSTNGIADIDFFIFECVGFLVVSIAMWLYMLIVKKYAYNPFKRIDLPRMGAAVAETGGTMLFIFATAINPILTAPISSSYCLITIIFARIFLKEKLTKKQYLCIALLLIGIALLSVSEILKA